MKDGNGKVINTKLKKELEIIEYLKQDNGYWLENEKWDLTEEFFIGKKGKGMKYLDFI